MSEISNKIDQLSKALGEFADQAVINDKKAFDDSFVVKKNGKPEWFLPTKYRLGGNCYVYGERTDSSTSNEYEPKLPIPGNRKRFVNVGTGYEPMEIGISKDESFINHYTIDSRAPSDITIAGNYGSYANDGEVLYGEFVIDIMRTDVNITYDESVKFMTPLQLGKRNICYARYDYNLQSSPEFPNAKCMVWVVGAFELGN